MKKILFIVPHLSTGGLPQVTTNKIQLLKDDYIIKCVEYGCYSWDFVVQKNRIKNLIGEENLITLWDDKSVLINLIDEFQPDIISMEEFPEFFMGHEITRQIYRKNRPYKIFETTHDSSFKPTSKIWFPDKFIFVSVFNAIQYSMFDIPYEVIEYPIENREKRKELFQEKLGLDKGWKHVVNVGLFTERKNQKYIFEIARKLENSKIKFHFIGNQADNFKSYWEPLMNNKPENCIVWGEKDNVNEFLEASDLFMFPSKGDRNNKELNPIAIKEAIEYGIPMMMYNLDVYCGKYDKLPQVKFLNGDIDNDVNNMMDILNVGGIDSLFNFGFNGETNQITINYNGNEKLNFNVSIRDMTSKAPMYWFNLPLEYPIYYWTIPIPIHIKRFKDNPNFRGFLVEFYDVETNELVFGQELIVNSNFYPRIPEFKFKPLDCNYINYYEFFVDRCFDDLRLENLDTVIDIGANVGLFAKYMYSINAKKVILVEANPYLKESIEYHLDNDLETSTIYMNPVYKEHTKIDFRFSKENSTIGSNVFDGNVGEYGQLNNLISCDTITIDDIYKDNNYGRISLFKCDIEGGEYPIFESITDEQIGLVDRFMVEFHENTNGQINIILEKLEKNNFEYDIIVYEMGRKTKADRNAKHGVIFAKPKNIKDEFKTITIVDCFVHNENVLNKLELCIDNLKKYNHTILLVSNTIVPEHIIKNVDYYLYNSNNILFKGEYTNSEPVVFWNEIGQLTTYEIVNTIQKHGLPVMVNLFNSLDLCKSLGFTHFQRVEVDDLYSNKGYEYITSVPLICHEQNKKGMFYFNEGRDVSFHYFYCEIEYFQQIINRINCEEDYKNYLQNNGYGTDFINVEKYLYDNINRKDYGLIIRKDGEIDMNSDFQGTEWNTETTVSNVSSKFNGCSTKLYNISGQDSIMLLSYNYNHFRSERKIIVNYVNGETETIYHFLENFAYWSFNIFENKIEKISVYDNQNDEFLYEIINQNILDYITFS